MAGRYLQNRSYLPVSNSLSNNALHAYWEIWWIFSFTAIKILALMVSFIMLTDFVSNNLYKPSRKNLRR